MDKKIEIAKILFPVYVLGPNRRIAVWVQGCLKNCSNCMSQEFRSFDKGYLYDEKYLYDYLCEIIENEDIDGITFTGGEPLLQNGSLRKLTLSIKRSHPRINIIVYTGYIYNSAKNSFKDFEGIQDSRNSLNLDWIDILIDGEYKSDMPTDNPLIGSSDQQIHILTQVGDDILNNSCFERSKNLQIFGDDNEVFLAGIPNNNDIHKIAL